VVRRVAAEAAASVPRVLAKPVPVCHFVAFNARSLDFVLRFWINDPADGVTNIRGAVLLALWDALKREKIDFPSPVQDLRLRESAHVVVDKLEESYLARGSGGGRLG
jgi:small-conductance mechanosensitive channel